MNWPTLFGGTAVGTRPFLCSGGGYNKPGMMYKGVPDKVNPSWVAPSRHTIFIRGFPGVTEMEDVRSFFADQTSSKVNIDFFSYSEDKRRLFLALRFETHEIAKEMLYKLDGKDILGHPVEISWFKDLRKARRDQFNEHDRYDRYPNMRGGPRGAPGFRRFSRGAPPPWVRDRRGSGGYFPEGRRYTPRYRHGGGSSRSRSRSRSRSYSGNRSDGSRYRSSSGGRSRSRSSMSRRSRYTDDSRDRSPPVLKQKGSPDSSRSPDSKRSVASSSPSAMKRSKKKKKRKHRRLDRSAGEESSGRIVSLNSKEGRDREKSRSVSVNWVEKPKSPGHISSTGADARPRTPPDEPEGDVSASLSFQIKAANGVLPGPMNPPVRETVEKGSVASKTQDVSAMLDRERDKALLSADNQRKAKSRKEEIEKGYRSDCETFATVVKMLISKDSTLEDRLLSCLKEILHEIGQKGIEDLRNYISDLVGVQEKMNL